MLPRASGQRLARPPCGDGGSAAWPGDTRRSAAQEPGTCGSWSVSEWRLQTWTETPAAGMQADARRAPLRKGVVVLALGVGAGLPLVAEGSTILCCGAQTCLVGSSGLGCGALVVVMCGLSGPEACEPFPGHVSYRGRGILYYRGTREARMPFSW